MSAREPAETSTLFERYFADGDVEGLLSLYEEEAVFATPNGTSTGHEEIRTTLKAYLDLGAKLEFGETLVFSSGGIAFLQTPWTWTAPSGATQEGATAEVARRQTDGTWKYIIDAPDGSALLSH